MDSGKILALCHVCTNKTFNNCFLIIRIYVNKLTKRENEHIFTIFHFYLKRVLKSSIFFDRTTAIFYASMLSAMKTLNYLLTHIANDFMCFFSDEVHLVIDCRRFSFINGIFQMTPSKKIRRCEVRRPWCPDKRITAS